MEESFFEGFGEPLMEGDLSLSEPMTLDQLEDLDLGELEGSTDNSRGQEEQGRVVIVEMNSRTEPHMVQFELIVPPDNELRRNHREPVIRYTQPGGERLSDLGAEVKAQLPFGQLLENLGYSQFLFIEQDPNGGAWILLANSHEINVLSLQDKIDFANEFHKLIFSEDSEGRAYFVMGIVHNEANQIPDVLDYLSQHSSDLEVKVGSLDVRSDSPTTVTITDYKNKVYESYSSLSGTYRNGPLQEISLVKRHLTEGENDEISKDFSSELLQIIEQSPILEKVMPWGELASKDRDDWCPNDGPVMFTRPGEQLVPVSGKNGLKCGDSFLDAIVSKVKFIEDTLFEDRTYPHFDYMTEDLEKTPVAVIGVLKSVHCGQQSTSQRRAKDAVAFHAADFDKLASCLQLNFDEPPMSQCKEWLNDAKLDKLRRGGIRYSKVTLADNDVYIIPRHVIHQVKTISATSSIMWQLKLQQHELIKTMPVLEPELPWLMSKITREPIDANVLGIDLQCFDQSLANIMDYFPRMVNVNLSPPVNIKVQDTVHAVSGYDLGPSQLNKATQIDDRKKKRKKKQVKSKQMKDNRPHNKKRIGELEEKSSEPTVEKLMIRIPMKNLRKLNVLGEVATKQKQRKDFESTSTQNRPLVIQTKVDDDGSRMLLDKAKVLAIPNKEKSFKEHLLENEKPRHLAESPKHSKSGDRDDWNPDGPTSMKSIGQKSVEKSKISMKLPTDRKDKPSDPASPGVNSRSSRSKNIIASTDVDIFAGQIKRKAAGYSESRQTKLVKKESKAIDHPVITRSTKLESQETAKKVKTETIETTKDTRSGDGSKVIEARHRPKSVSLTFKEWKDVPRERIPRKPKADLPIKTPGPNEIVMKKKDSTGTVLRKIVPASSSSNVLSGIMEGMKTLKKTPSPFL